MTAVHALVVAVALATAPATVPADPGGEFTACMRANGLPAFPDGSVTPDGRLVLEPATPPVDPFSPGYRAALEECEGVLPPGTELPEPPRPPTAPQPPQPPAVPPPAPPEPSAP